MLERHLVTAFVAVAEDLSFVRGAARLGISQPQVSQRIRKFEQLLGYPLFRRSTRKVNLTGQAEDLLPFARKICDAYGEADDFVRRQRSIHALRLAVGNPYLILSNQARNSLIKRIIEQNRDIKLDVSIGVSTDLLGSLREGALDAVITYRFRDPKNPDSVRLPDRTEAVVIDRRLAYFLVPDESFSGKDSGPIGIFANVVTLPPGSQCPDALGSMRTYLQRHGATFEVAPEPSRETLEHFAWSRRLMLFLWATPGEPVASSLPSMTPFRCPDQPVMELCLFTRRTDTRKPVRKIRAIAEQLNAALQPP